ncbi:hypothetical protein Hdeb2414_s0003g00103361 [Helianthus debilis subsp. tardiflorus]
MGELQLERTICIFYREKSVFLQQLRRDLCILGQLACCKFSDPVLEVVSETLLHSS